MRANVLSTPTFRYLGGNFIDVEIDEVNPKPWSNLDDEEKISDLNRVFTDRKVGISEDAMRLNEEKSNSRRAIVVDKNVELETIKFDFDSEHDTLLDDIKIQAEKDTKSSFIIDYINKESVKTFRNSRLYVYAKENAVVNIYLITRQDENAKIWQSIGVLTDDNAKVNLYTVDIGVGEKVYSDHSYVMGQNSELNIEGSYFLEKSELLDILYNIDIYGKMTNTNVEVNGILKDTSKKIFRGTLDFKRGAKASIGSEEEYVTLLDKTVRSKSLPIILCSEENITGNHAASAGQIDDDMLFYIMSRGFSMEEAKSLIVKARLVPVIDKIPNEDMRLEILQELKNKMTK